MNKEIAKKTYEMDKPLQMVKMANILKSHIIKHKLYVEIVGKNYVMVEGWQFAGGMMGLFPRIVKVECLGPNKWMAQAEIVNKKTNCVVGSGFAICSKEEQKKKTFDEYAILSMAQTRAIGKAYRNLIGWVIKLAGYEGTPAEEMKNGVKSADPKEEPKTSGAGSIMAGESEKERIKETAKVMGLDTIAKMEKATGLKINFNGMTKKQSSIVLFKLLEKKAKK